QRRAPDAPDGILLWDLKRFARDRLDNAFFKADLRRRGYTVIFLSDNIPQGGIGHIYEAMLEWKAEQDLQDISKDVKRGLADLVGTRGADGKYLGLCPGKPPTGFVILRVILYHLLSPIVYQVFSAMVYQVFSPTVYHLFSAKLYHRGGETPANLVSFRSKPIQDRGETWQAGGKTQWIFENC
ncbi:MAG: hypothetical protein DRI48_08680, partial [Chloroflexi bacterium]